jgi:multidrug efflux pump subunit AcrA (membrane-fusion protein)
MKVQFDLSAADYLQRTHFSSFCCRPSFAPDTLFPMRLESITPKADNSQLYRATLTFAHEADKRLTPGMTVSVEVIIERGKLKVENGISLPVSCVRQDGEENIVWVVDTGGILRRRPVTLGEVTRHGFVLILSGLDGGERVVRAAASSLKEGERVRVLPEPSVTNVGNLL